MRILLLAALIIAPGAWAQPDAERLAAAETLVELLDVDRTLETIRASILQNAAQMAGDDADPRARAILDRYTTQMYDEMVEHLDAEATAARLYAETFSTAELEELIAFYRTPLGEKLLAQLPQLMQATALEINEKFRTFAPRLQELSKQMAAELDAVRYDEDAGTETAEEPE